MLLLWTMTIRPNGWVLLPLMVMFLAFRLGAWKAVLTIALPGLVLLVVSVLLLKPLQSGIQNENPMDFLSKGIVIWDYDAWNRQMPPTETDSTSDWRNIGSYAMRYPMETLTLVAARVGIVLARVRPYYPWQMNFRIGVRYIVMYGLLLLGIIWYWRHLAVKLLVAAIHVKNEQVLPQHRRAAWAVLVHHPNLVVPPGNLAGFDIHTHCAVGAKVAVHAAVLNDW